MLVVESDGYWHKGLAKALCGMPRRDQSVADFLSDYLGTDWEPPPSLLGSGKRPLSWAQYNADSRRLSVSNW